MAHQIGWHVEAYNELHAIAEYISLDSESYASAVTTRIVSAADDLVDFPKMGRRVPEWDDENVRERIVDNYRLIYQLLGARILILAVVHGARLLPDDVRQRR
ncbi:MAG: type II toxin-antitoxin system RelE/ParE family toxin [Chthoniobacterales bacterium]|nr:type II toxin-antitoxin system RelE/ParE family toxin [Chthoniobacterales bacterium]